MKETEFEISSNLFGGYNKKNADEYIQTLHEMITELQNDNEKLHDENTQLKLRMNEAEGYYRILWEKSSKQKTLIQKQDAAIRHQQKMLKEMSEQSTGVSLRKIESALSKQMKKIKEMAQSLAE